MATEEVQKVVDAVFHFYVPNGYGGVPLIEAMWLAANDLGVSERHVMDAWAQADKCAYCGEEVNWEKCEAAEIYKMEWPEDHDSILVHADCMVPGDIPA